MKFDCSCGFVLSDSTDGISYKAHLIPDHFWEFFWEKIDEAIEHSGPSPKEKEAACMELRMTLVESFVYQCPQCGRVYFYNDNFEAFVPESEKVSKKMFYKD